MIFHYWVAFVVILAALLFPASPLAPKRPAVFLQSAVQLTYDALHHAPSVALATPDQQGCVAPCAQVGELESNSHGRWTTQEHKGS